MQFSRTAFQIAASCIVISAVTFFGSARAGETTASLKVTFKYDGKAPAPKPLALNGAFCGNFKHMDESLIVNADNNGLKDVFVYIYTGRRGTKLPEMKLKPEVKVLDNKNCRFEPHTMFLKAGDTLKVTNSDNTGHNVNIAFFNNKQMGVMVPQNQPVNFQLTDSEPAVVPAVCNIHPWMKARVLVLDHPFAAISDENGVCEIKGLPVGTELIFRANHETLSFSKIKLNGENEAWRANKFTVTLEAGENDLGVVEVR